MQNVERPEHHPNKTSLDSPIIILQPAFIIDFQEQKAFLWKQLRLLSDINVFTVLQLAKAKRIRTGELISRNVVSFTVTPRVNINLLANSSMWF